MDLLKPDQAASKLAISTKTLHRLCREGRMGYVEINDKERRFTVEQIQEYIDRQTIPPVIDNAGIRRIHLPRKGGGTKKSKGDSRADLRKEMSLWQ